MTKGERRGLVIGLLLALFLADWTISNPGPCVPSEQQQNDQRPEKRCSLAKTFVVRAISSVIDWVDRRHDFVTAAATVIIALFTITLWRATSGLLKSANDEARHTREALDVSKRTLIASQRAWIKRVKTTVGQSLRFHEDGGATGAIALFFTNAGNAPALEVAARAWLLPAIGGVVPTARAQQCFDEFRCEQITPAARHGVILYPGENYPESVGLSRHSYDVHATAEDMHGATDPATGYVSLYVACCVDYTFPSDVANRHQMGFLLELKTTKAGPISTKAQRYPPDLLMLNDTGFGGGNRAD